MSLERLAVPAEKSPSCTIRKLIPPIDERYLADALEEMPINQRRQCDGAIF
ncbi:MAG: hypothetical protein P0116_04155 [Candidatus Nitrosocosmicus sp.]|nr:hypothetical protein [Candidatus Nitrosocosmicus sp.]